MQQGPVLALGLQLGPNETSNFSICYLKSNIVYQSIVVLSVLPEEIDCFTFVLLLLLLLLLDSLLLSPHHFLAFTKTVFLQTKMRNMNTPRSRFRMSTVRKK